MPDWGFLDDFAVMSLIGALSDGEDPGEELSDDEEVDSDIYDETDDAEGKAERLEAAQAELDALQDELISVEFNEPADCASDAYMRWEARRDLLEEQISELESEIWELED